MFISDFLRGAHLPRISAQEPLPDQDLIQQVTAAKEIKIAPAAGPTASCIRSLLFLAAGGLSQAHRIVQEKSTTDAAYIHGVIIAPTMTSTMPGTADLRGPRVGR